jgi:hypothetical protein
MTTTWCLRLILSAALNTIGVAGLILWPSIERLLSPTAPEERPDSGADEKFPAELRALRRAPVAPELVRQVPPAEQMVADHEALNGISVALDHFDRVISDELSRFLRKQPRTLLRLPSSVEHTAEFPVVV